MDGKEIGIAEDMEDIGMLTGGKVISEDLGAKFEDSRIVDPGRANLEFLAYISHEIRTPMNSIIGLTELLLEDATAENQREYLEIMKSSANVVLRIVNEILDFSSIEAEKVELEQLDFSIRQVLQESLKPLEFQATRKGLKFSCEISREVPERLVGDPGRLRQVITNLVANAVKFAEEGEVYLQVQPAEPVQAGPEATGLISLHFSVRDSGIGIPAEAQKRLFRPFSQLDSSTTRKYGGTGLGLSISRQLVNLMAGRMWVESEADKGSCFHFTARFGIDGRETEESVRQDVGSTPAVIHSSAGICVRCARPGQQDGFRILLAEDNPANQIVAEHALERGGYLVRLASNGNEVLNLLKCERFALILMDVQMPEMDGFQTTAEIRRRERITGNHIPIVAMTGHAMKGDRERCLSAGMDEYISKPVERQKLVELIERFG